MWRRTCQECGHTQSDRKPENGTTDAYKNRKCHVCKSSAMDHGAEVETAEELHRAYLVANENYDAAEGSEDVTDKQLTELENKVGATLRKFTQHFLAGAKLVENGKTYRICPDESGEDAIEVK